MSLNVGRSVFSKILRPTLNGRLCDTIIIKHEGKKEFITEDI